MTNEHHNPFCECELCYPEIPESPVQDERRTGLGADYWDHLAKTCPNCGERLTPQEARAGVTHCEKHATMKELEALIHDARCRECGNDLTNDEYARDIICTECAAA